MFKTILTLIGPKRRNQMLTLIALYAFKLPYLAWENYMVAKFVRTTRHEMSTRLCQRIVHSPYPFFTRHSTAELENLLGQDTLQFSTGINGFQDGKKSERNNTLREKERADTAETHADATEQELARLREELRLLRGELAGS